MKAASLRHLIDIEYHPQQPYPRDAFGNVTANWIWAPLHRNVPAEIAPGAAKELFAAEKVLTTSTHVVSIRWIAGITSKMRVRFGTRIFRILGVINPLERNIELKLACTEEF